ncbi:MAG: hypothetical protein GC161_01475, partial [Planctomycetaceae bacterium]|nr:hypothetical protein [Planctomycetaceae bacterium]
MVHCLSRIVASACLASLLPGALATQTPETKPLHVLIDHPDGLPVGGVGPADARTTPEDLRFWVGHGLSLGHIRIGDRDRRFFEEADQPYQNEIARVIFDEGTTTSGAHRLYVLTAAQRNSTPPRPGTVYLLNANTPSDAFVVDSYDLVDTLTAPPDPLWEYDISDIAMLPGTNWIVAVGGAKQGETEQALVLLLSREVNNGVETLELHAEVRRDPIPLRGVFGPTFNPCATPSSTTRKMRGLRTALVHRIGMQWLLFATATVDPKGRGISGVEGIILHPAHSDPEQRIQFATDTSRVFDPLEWYYCEPHTTFDVLPSPPPGNEFAMFSLTHGTSVVKEAVGSDPAQHFLYYASGRYLQVTEIDITDFVSAGFDYADAQPLYFETRVTFEEIPNDPEGDLQAVGNFQDFSWIQSVQEGTADLLFTTGSNAIYCLKRTSPNEFGRTWQKFNDPPVTGHLMRENIGAGDRYHLWTVCYDTPSPWTVFDVTDRSLNPGIFPPEKLEGRYLPAGTDGAVAIPEWNSIYATNFAGLVRYDWFYDFANEAHSALPVYDSYQPAVHNNVEYVTEQVE